ncbi:MAG: hypothetical protein Q8K18_10530 [Burkholderiales bacterium]|nr:hypothetical protein [Burkholderiales bacterium]
MEREHTLRILNALAGGVDPATGEKFSADSPYQHPDTVRALFDAVRAIEGGRAPAPAAAVEHKPAAPPQSGAGSRWTSEEEQRLAAGFDSGKTVAELAKLHGRTHAGIEARLLKLGKIDASALTAPLRYPPKPAAQPARRSQST